MNLYFITIPLTERAFEALKEAGTIKVEGTDHVNIKVSTPDQDWMLQAILSEDTLDGASANGIDISFDEDREGDWMNDNDCVIPDDEDEDEDGEDLDEEEEEAG